MRRANPRIFNILHGLVRLSDGGTNALHTASAEIEDYVEERCAEAVKASRRDVGMRLGQVLANLLEAAD